MLIKNEKNKINKVVKQTRSLKTLFKKTFFLLNTCIVIFIISFVFYKSSSKINFYVNAKISEVKNLFIPKEYEFSYTAFSDIVKYTLISNFSEFNVENFTINSDFKNINRFYSQLDRASESNNTKKYSKGTLIIDKEGYEVKFRPKGDRLIHYDKEKPSFSIKVLNAKSIKGMSSFSIQNPSIRNYLSEQLWLELLKNNEIISPSYDFINLTVNGDDLGIYSYEEKPTTFMLERLGKKNSSILKFSEAYGTDISTNPEIVVINSEDVPFVNQKIAVSILRNFVDGKSTVSETFDLDKLAIFFAITDLCKTYHGLYAKSVRYYYNTYTNLLEPIPFDGHAGWEGPLLTIDLIDNNNPIGKADPKNEFTNWLKLFFNKKNKKFTDLYYEKVSYYSSNEYLNQVLNDENLKSKMELSKKMIYKSFPTEQTNLTPYYFDYKDYLNKNSLFMREKLLKDFNIQFFTNISENNIKISSNNFVYSKIPIKILSFNSKNYSYKIDKSIDFWEDLDFDLKPKDSIFSDIILNKKLEVKYKTFGGKIVIKGINLFPLNNEKGNYSSDYLDRLIYQEKVIKKSNSMSFHGNDISLDDLLIIPDSIKLYVNSGQKITFKDKGAIISYGDVEFNGTNESSIIINYIKNKENTDLGGYFLAIGPSNVSIKGVEFKNLINPQSKDIPGSVTIYNSKAIISNTIFDNNYSEDFLNLIDCQFELTNVKFKNCQSDCFDSDFSNGDLKNVSFLNSKNDGLDVSGSIINGDILSFDHIDDKAISVGEGSTLSINNIKINNSEIGITCKDGSSFTGSDIILDKVRVPIAIFQKKNRFKDPQLTLKNYSSKNFELEYLIQKSFFMNLNSKIIKGEFKDVESLLYGNNFGIKTVK